MTKAWRVKGWFLSSQPYCQQHFVTRRTTGVNWEQQWHKYRTHIIASHISRSTGKTEILPGITKLGHSQSHVSRSLQNFGEKLRRGYYFYIRPTDWRSSGQHFCFVFWLSKVKILVKNPGNLLQGYCGFSHSLWEHAGRFLKLGHDRFLAHPFQFIIR